MEWNAFENQKYAPLKWNFLRKEREKENKDETYLRLSNINKVQTAKKHILEWVSAKKRTTKKTRGNSYSAAFPFFLNGRYYWKLHIDIPSYQPREINI